MKLFKKIFAALAAGALLSSCGSALKSENGITEISLLSAQNDVSLVLGESGTKSYFTVTGENDTASDGIICVNADEEVAEVVFSKTELDGIFAYTVEAVAAGETYFCFKTADGVISSETVHVTVTDAENEETEVTAEETIAVPETEAVSETADTAADTEEDLAEAEYSTPIETDSEIIYYESEYYTSTEPPESTAVPESPRTDAPEVITQPSAEARRTVYVTPTGKRYHFSSSCAGKNGTEVTLEEAAKTRTPCKKCAGG